MKSRKEIIAAACHSAWYAYSVLALNEDGEPWEFAPDWQKKSLYDAIDFWDDQCIKYQEEVLDLVNPDDEKLPASMSSWARDALPELSHQNWMEYKKSEGWVYGEVKDPEKKTHPCMVPYCDLPDSQRIKDMVVVEAYIALMDGLK